MHRRAYFTIVSALMIAFGISNSAVQAQLRDKLQEIIGEAQRTTDRDSDRNRDRGDDQGGQRDRDRDRQPTDNDARLLPPDSDRGGRWYLGVEVEYRDYGAQITRVVLNSPASRAGLEMRDVIVTVNGYQIGRLAGQLYPLDRELELRADRMGRVLLLVLNHRNGQLTPLPVRLTPSEDRPHPIDARTVRGTVNVRRAVTLPREAVLSVNLLDVTDRLRTVVVRQRSYSNLGPLPIPYELVLDAGDIRAGRSYALSAEITVNGLASYRTSERYPVFQRENQGRVDMLLVPARQ
jgi:uncharacterized lipoprotein YbaY